MNDQPKASFWDRTLANLRGVWGRIASADSGAQIARTTWSPDLDEQDRGRLLEQMRACLEARGGEVSARARAAGLGHAYLALNEIGRKRFLRLLTDTFGVDRTQVDAAVAALLAAKTPAERNKAEARVRRSLIAPRERLLTQFNGLPEGVKFLVDLRTELLDWERADPALVVLEEELKTLLASWFDVGFLELRQITWSAPASLLEKLFAYEAVHEIKSWDDLKNRLAADRRCFAFFHPRMPDEPLIFVWVALVRGIATNVQVLLDEDAPLEDVRAADTAIFYSISNAQDGLRGISFGNFLIKRVLDSLSAELKGLRVFATLSPIPGLMNWFRKSVDDAMIDRLVPENEQDALMAAAARGTPLTAIKEILATPGWHVEPRLSEALRMPLLRLAAQYLVREKRSSGTALDSVAHFHLNNGARVEQLDWLADISVRGLEQSAGIMLNYRYEPDDIEENHESYRSGHEVITSPSVQQLLTARKTPAKERN